MHRCLLVEELAFRIAEACAPDYKDFEVTSQGSGRGTVCALAQTCRALQDPALNVLWYYQVDLRNLFRCFPDDLWRKIFEGSKSVTVCTSTDRGAQLVCAISWCVVSH